MYIYFFASIHDCMFVHSETPCNVKIRQCTFLDVMRKLQKALRQCFVRCSTN